MNSSETETRTVATGSGSEGYLLTSDSLDSRSISLNGTVLAAADDGTPPRWRPRRRPDRSRSPASVAFVVEPTDVRACSDDRRRPRPDRSSPNCCRSPAPRTSARDMVDMR